jgi:hypothetical protein
VPSKQRAVGDGPGRVANWYMPTTMATTSTPTTRNPTGAARRLKNRATADGGGFDDAGGRAGGAGTMVEASAWPQ